ncbi:cupredoxin domain-containing protein [uncultured Brevundimonas sp.]|uniref:cupredoxin domain-containing protein n=1 Tax=uncultured Brevundimonas sp. TaxID=213418 RepID=UPI0030ECAC59|tara:strand:- start:117264 stop:117608 length:345 start_codon:yes stop_codon:yes gene_type:complete
MQTPDQPRRALLLAFAAAAAVTAFPAVAAAAARTHTIVMDKMKFGPSPAGLRVGDTILWVNRDAFRHTATAGNGTFDVDLAPGASGRTTLRTAGTIPYVCRFHPGMTGVLTVAA